MPGAVPPIVPEPLWQAAQAKHGTRPFGVGRPWHRPYLLGGLIVCAQCGKRFWANKQGRGWEIAYYVCGGYVASGTAVCDGFRIPLSYLETAVLDGIQKRLQRVLDPGQLRRRLLELLPPAPAAAPPVQSLKRQLQATEGKLARLVETLAAGPEDLPTVRRTLVTLERERARLKNQLDQARATPGGTGADRLQGVVDDLLEGLSRLPAVLASGTVEQRRAVVRSFLAGIRINKAARQAILRWHRLPRGLSVKLVELRGIEPLTPRLPASCSPS